MNLTITLGGQKYLVEALKLSYLKEVKMILWIIAGFVAPNQWAGWFCFITAVITLIQVGQIHNVAAFKKVKAE